VAQLTGRAAIVTGASTGLGAAVAEVFAREGADVLICSRSPEKLAAAARGIRKSLPEEDGRKVQYHAADVTDSSTAPTLVQRAISEFGRLDIIVCNAGGPPPGNFGDCDDSTWLRAYNLILLSTIRLVRAAVPHLRKSGSGRVISIASISGFRPVPRLALSNTLRPALMGLTRHLALELAADNILVNTIAPGFFDTERSREVLQSIAEDRGIELDQLMTETTGKIPFGRQGIPTELGEFAAWLASEENSYLTGQTIPLDGGYLVSG
jgi:3-oxoacyl-[acyl-carrier protein] reductase